ncbi:hypothetical protein B0T19DRAFT_102188 [Cercophora scortea]|uniref:Uncharacterized protein n=1 Tax=Cercophora scortea TaxID=314031 RepID=A0AAE0IWG3_9PEZI|nr:hypothetical protein B0T19DRAFT_102188 [Cercophora scortea]
MRWDVLSSRRVVDLYINRVCVCVCVLIAPNCFVTLCPAHTRTHTPRHQQHAVRCESRTSRAIRKTGPSLARELGQELPRTHPEPRRPDALPRYGTVCDAGLCQGDAVTGDWTALGDPMGTSHIRASFTPPSRLTHRRPDCGIGYLLSSKKMSWGRGGTKVWGRRLRSGERLLTTLWGGFLPHHARIKTSLLALPAVAWKGEREPFP